MAVSDAEFIRRPCAALVLLALALLTLSGCTPFVDRDQAGVFDNAKLTLAPGSPLGQTFVARHGGLSGVELWLAPPAGRTGELRLHLRAESGAGDDLAEAVLPLAEVAGPGFYRLAFAPLADSHGRYFYAEVELRDAAPLAVGAAPGYAYLDGAAYRNAAPLDAQLAFRLTYDPWLVLLDLARAAVGWLGLLIAAALLYVLPGWALLSWLPRAPAWPWGQKLSIAIALSLALYPLLMLWTGLLGLRLGPGYAWLPPAAGVAALAWRARRRRQPATPPEIGGLGRRPGWPELTLVIVVALICITRLLPVRSLEAPLWGDGYQHSVITQLLLDHGGLFDSWAPYADLRTFTYHFGFHAAAAVLSWGTGLDAVRGTLLTGQLLNILACLALYGLATRLGGSRWAGVIAVLFAGLLAPMPMQYVNWGRYTQLAGQAILPGAVLLTWALASPLGVTWLRIRDRGRLLPQPRPLGRVSTDVAMSLRAGCAKQSLGHARDCFGAAAPRNDGHNDTWRGVCVCAALTAAGLALSHYRVLIFYAAFCLVLLVLTPGWAGRRRTAGRLTLVALGAGLLFVPWLARMFGGLIPGSLLAQLSVPAGDQSSFTQAYNSIGDLGAYLPMWGWAALGLAAVVAVWRLGRGALLMLGWWLLLALFANPAAVGLPGSGVVNNFAMLIAAYIPAAVLIGAAGGLLAGRRALRGRWAAALTAVLLAAALLGARGRLADVPVTPQALLTRPDVRALAWIRQHTPVEGARFLVNAFGAYDGTLYVGSDGGWWLPLLTGRASTLPPLTYSMERGAQSDTIAWVNALLTGLRSRPLDSPESLALLRARGVTHIYIGQRQGRANYNGPDVLDPLALAASPAFRLIYRQDRVWVFEIVSS